MSSSLDMGLGVEELRFSRIKDGTDRHIIRLLVTSQLEDGETPLLGSYLPSGLSTLFVLSKRH